jgi:putative transposase
LATKSASRSVDQLVESLGLRGLALRGEPHLRSARRAGRGVRSRPLEGRYPYLFVDAKVEKVRDGGRVRRKCVVIAHGVHDSGRREIIGLEVGEAETAPGVSPPTLP